MTYGLLGSLLSALAGALFGYYLGKGVERETVRPVVTTTEYPVRNVVTPEEPVRK